MNVRWVTPLGVETASTSYCCSNALQAVPQPNTAAEQDRHQHDVQVVDETGGEERAHHGRAPADADVLTGGRVPRHLECIRRRGVEEVERRTTLHLQRRARTVGQDVRRRVERRVVAPPPAPLRVVLPARRAELAGAHDLRTDPGSVPLGHRVDRDPRCRPARRGLRGGRTGWPSSTRGADARRGRTASRVPAPRRWRTRRARSRSCGCGRATWRLLRVVVVGQIG